MPPKEGPKPWNPCICGVRTNPRPPPLELKGDGKATFPVGNCVPNPWNPDIWGVVIKPTPLPLIGAGNDPFPVGKVIGMRACAFDATAVTMHRVAAAPSWASVFKFILVTSYLRVGRA